MKIKNAYSLILLCFGICFLFQSCVPYEAPRISNKETIFEIENPTKADFYHLVNTTHQFFAKVERFTADSIYFRYVKGDMGARTGTGVMYGDLMLDRKEKQVAGVSKEDILSSPKTRDRDNANIGKIVLPNLNKGLPLMLKDIAVWMRSSLW